MRSQFLPSLAILAVFLCLGSASLAQAGTVTLIPSKDNTLIQVRPGDPQLSNGQGDIFHGRTNQDFQQPATISIRRGLVAFDVAGSVPSGATITSVTLTMRDLAGNNGDPVVELHRVLQDWGEGSSAALGPMGGMGAAAQQNDVTWNYRFYNFASPSSSPAWNTPGGDYSSTVSGSATIYDDLGAGQSFSWLSTNNSQMLADVQNWLDNPAANFGWLFLGDESRGQSAKRFNSGESNVAPNVAPKLLIMFDEFVPPPPAPEPGTGLIAISMLAIAWRSRRRN